MSRKDAGRTPRRGRRWTFRISFLVLFVAVVGTLITVRWLWGPDRATAQGAPAQASSAQPASRPAAQPANPAARPAGPVLPTVAVVNGEEITRQQLAQATLVRYGEQVLESLVNKHLILQACNDKGIVITAADIDDEIESIAKKFNLSTERWLELLATERNVEPQQYRRDIIWPTLALRRLAADRLVVTQEEMEKAWESEFGEKVSVRMIATHTREKAEEIRAYVVAHPDDFGKLAKDLSIDKNSAAARGIIPPVRRHVGDPEIERVVFALNDGEISPVVAAANQFFIFQCERHLPATRPGADYLHVAQARIKDRLIDGKMRQAATELFKQLQEQAQGRIVNVYNDPQLRQQHPGVAAMINNRPLTVQELAEECISRYGREVLESEINRLLLMQEQRRRNITVTEQDLDAEIARAADAYGYVKPDGSPDIETWLKDVTQEEDVTVDVYLQDAVWPSAALKKLVSGKVQVTEEDMRKGFEANYGERVEVLAVVLGNQRTAVEVHALARDNPTDKYFAELAHKFSIEPVSQANYGQVPPIRRYGGQPLLEDEAFELNPGELSGVIAVGDKYIVMRCVGRTKPVVLNREDVQTELYKDISEKKMRIAMSEEFERLKESARIENLLAGTRQDGHFPRKIQPAGFLGIERKEGPLGTASSPRPTAAVPATRR
jgi:parvulin-like peptidyl-prolyl isomerase